MFLKEEILQLESSIIKYEQTNLKVSFGSVGWQIDHSLRVIIGIVKMMEESNPSEYSWSLNFRRIFIFWLGIIPRGKVKAPNRVVAQNPITKDTLDRLLITTKNILEEVFPKLEKHNFFVHFLLGKLNVKSTKRFLKIHTKHHLKIIEDIITS